MAGLFFCASLVLLSLLPFAAHAKDCIDPVGTEGAIVYSSTQNVPMYCNGVHWVAFGQLNPGAGGAGCATVGLGIKAEGDIFYNLDHHVLQYCDGDDWRAVGVGGGFSFSGPTDCPAIGDLCADGTVFAGYHPTLHEHLFIPTTDQGTTSAWKTSTGTDDIATDSTYDGRTNTNQVANSTTFPAFKLCKDLGTGGHSDWYLPSQVELYYLWAIRGTIEAGGNITNFQSNSYWSSTEYGTSHAWSQNFTLGYQNYNIKTNNYRVRCVRR